MAIKNQIKAELWKETPVTTVVKNEKKEVKKEGEVKVPQEEKKSKKKK